MNTRKRARAMSFRQQMRQSISELQSLVAKGDSPLGGGQFTVRTLHVKEPSAHNDASVRAIRRSLGVSQAVFAQLLGVSGSLVRAWELGTRTPAPIARRLLDQIRQNPAAFSMLVRSTGGAPRRVA